MAKHLFVWECYLYTEFDHKKSMMTAVEFRFHKSVVAIISRSLAKQKMYLGKIWVHEDDSITLNQPRLVWKIYQSHAQLIE